MYWYDDGMSLMTNDNIRLFPHDRIVASVFWFIPRWVEPNYLTVLRLLLVPILVVLFLKESWNWALIVFLIAALTDLLDGTLARTRQQITLWGTIADPVADKLLIGSFLGLFLWHGLHPLLAGLLLAVEVLIILNAFRRQRKGYYASANNFGKVKMSLQVLGVLLLFLQLFWFMPWLGMAAHVAFGISLLFALCSLITYGL